MNSYSKASDFQEIIASFIRDWCPSLKGENRNALTRIILHGVYIARTLNAPESINSCDLRKKKKKEKEKILIHMYDNKVLDHSYREIFNSYLYWLWKNIATLYENQIEKKLET